MTNALSIYVHVVANYKAALSKVKQNSVLEDDTVSLDAEVSGTVLHHVCLHLRALNF